MHKQNLFICYLERPTMQTNLNRLRFFTCFCYIFTIILLIYLVWVTLDDVQRLFSLHSGGGSDPVVSGGLLGAELLGPLYCGVCRLTLMYITQV